MWIYSINLRTHTSTFPFTPSLGDPFKWQIYQFRAHTFSLSLAPWVFIMVAREFASLIQAQNTALHQFWTTDWIKPCPETLCPAQGLDLPPLRGARLILEKSRVHLTIWVLVSLDNSTIVSFIIGGGEGRHSPCPSERRRNSFSAGLQSADLPACGLHSEENVIVNLLSHQDHSLLGEWSFNQEVIRLLLCLWGSPHMNLFSTRWNPKPQPLCLHHQIPWYLTPFSALADSVGLRLPTSSASHQDPDQAASIQCPASPNGSG